MDASALLPWSAYKRLVLKPAWFAFYRTFGLAFGLRATLSILRRLFALIRSKRPTQALSLRALLTERHVVFREEAARVGLFVGGFSGIFTLVYHLIQVQRAATSRVKLQDLDDESALQHIMKTHGERKRSWDAAVAGAAAGLSLVFLNDETRQTIGLYSLVRAIQSMYLISYARGHWEAVCGKALKESLDVHGSVMYSYVMRPSTLPESYWMFIVRTGPIPKDILEAARHAADGMRIPVERLNLPDVPLSPNAPIVPCSVLHRSATATCTSFNWSVFVNTAKKALVLYLPLNAITYIGLNPRALLQNPVNTLYRMCGSTLQSTVFLSCFVTGYMICCCTYRKVITSWDHKFFYWIAGFICSASIYIERPHRRAELSLYVLPRAIQSIGILFLLRRLRIPRIPYFFVLLFSFSTAVLMHLYATAPKHLAPFVQAVLDMMLPHIARRRKACDTREHRAKEQEAKEQDAV